jgi:hypothetical protein
LARAADLSRAAQISVDGRNRKLHFCRSFSLLATQSWSAQIAQLAEHVLGKDEVAGSNPVLGSMQEAKIIG